MSGDSPLKAVIRLLKNRIDSVDDSYRILGTVVLLTAIDDCENGAPDYMVGHDYVPAREFLCGECISLWTEAAEWDNRVIPRYLSGELTWQDVVKKCIPIRTTKRAFNWQRYQ